MDVKLHGKRRVDDLLSRSTAIVTLAVAVCFFTIGAHAQLTSTSFGFPTIVQASNSVAWSQDTADALDFQDVSITFPVVGSGVPFGPGVCMAFPNIHQTSLQTQSVTHTDFAQTSQFAEFAYPFVGVGAVGLPGFGFGF